MNDELKKLTETRGKLALFYDTETTGFAKPGKTIEHQPHIVQLAWVLVRIPDRGCDFEEIASCTTLLRLPDDVEVPDGAYDVHGISATATRECGVEPYTALQMLFQAGDRASIRVAHNRNYDDDMLDIASDRHNRRPDCLYDMEPLVDNFLDGKSYDTMTLSTPVLAIPPTPRMVKAGHGRKSKSPKLEEAYLHFTGERMSGAHDALVDVRACMTVFQGLIWMGERSDQSSKAQIDLLALHSRNAGESNENHD
jgi:DNA polymerase-3 subunit epsilon